MAQVSKDERSPEHSARQKRLSWAPPTLRRLDVGVTSSCAAANTTETSLWYDVKVYTGPGACS